MKYKYNGQWYDIYSSPLLNNLLIGEILTYAGNNIPGGYLICDGAAISRTEYSELFDVIGEIYGSGDGSTTFNLPNLKGKVAVGLDSNNTNFNTLGKIGGEETHILADNELPNTTLKYLINSSTGLDWPVARGSDYGFKGVSLGESSPINNLQPYLTTNYIIRAKKNQSILANISSVIDSLDGNSTTDAPSISAINKRFTYSTNEQVIGTWVNGKPLYRKSFYRASLIAGTSQTVQHGIANVDRIWLDSSFSMAMWSNGNSVILPFIHQDSYTSSIFLYDVGPTSYSLKSGLDRSGLTGYITFNYTKTTD